jgi:hypothetical protein
VYKFESDKLRGMVRRYIGNNDGHLAAVRELFGRAAEDRVTTAVRPVGPGGHVVDTIEVEYAFPRTFAIVEADDEHTVSPTSQQLFLSLYDRAWLGSVLSEDGRALYELLGWTRDNVLPAAANGEAPIESIEGPRTTKSEYAGLNKPARYKWWSSGMHTEAVAFTAEGRRVLVVEQVMEDFPGGTPFQRKHGVRIWASASPLANVPVLDRGTNPVITRVHSGVAGALFPPTHREVVWKRPAATTLKSYEWDTASGWHVVARRTTFLY